MADRVIVCAEQVTTEWLSRVLRASGALSRGGVAGFDLEAGGGNWSDHLRIALRYTPGARGDLPRRLFLKMVNTDLEDEFFDDSEVRYYTRDYVDVPDVPLVRCYDGAYSAELQRYHLLLDDLTKTHHTAKKMTLEYGLALADGFAAMHARWWGARGLAEAGVGDFTIKEILGHSNIKSTQIYTKVQVEAQRKALGVIPPL